LQTLGKKQIYRKAQKRTANVSIHVRGSVLVYYPTDPYNVSFENHWQEITFIEVFYLANYYI
jgi:hypothetical protein